MNVTTLMNYVEYDTDRFATFAYDAYAGNKQFNFTESYLTGISLGTSVIAIFNRMTAEVLYVYTLPPGAEEATIWYTDDFPNHDEFPRTVTEKEMLELVQECLDGEKEEILNLQMEPDLLHLVDSMASDLDITRNSMLVKIICQKAEEVLAQEQSTQS